MNKFYLSFLLCLATLSLFSQVNQWAWISGDNLIGQKGIYGTKGTASPVNRPGARNAAVKWMDTSGKLWLYGGTGHDVNGYLGYLNDLWKYDPATNLWTWISGDNNIRQLATYGTKGVATASNNPGSRYSSVSWSDNTGRLWLFGGSGLKDTSTVGMFNDLWVFDPATSLWTWISGDNTTDQNGVYGSAGVAAPANKPGSRQQSVSWKDGTGNFWLFGGFGRDKSGRNDAPLNDLWRFNTVTSQWTWVNGDSVAARSGVYGIKGTPAPENKPGSRNLSISWADASGNIWIFGGYGSPAGNDAGYLNDLWKYIPSLNQWTWMSGDTIIDQSGTYGIKGTAAPANKPGARHSSTGWIDTSGNLLLFSGWIPPIGSRDAVNDWWSYNPSTNLWTWIDGNNLINQQSVYGTKGVFAPENTPGSRHSSLSWMDASGSLYLFGGSGFATDSSGDMNDLWKYSFKVNAPLPVTLVSFTAAKQHHTALLNWSTSAEINNKYFTIEHSTDGIRFDSVGKVNAASTRSTTNYQFIHDNPATGNNFYRLKQVDADLAYTYTIIRKVDFNSGGFGYTILQNPVFTNLRLSLQLTSFEKTVIEIRDAAGRLYTKEEKQFTTRQTIYSIPVNKLLKGTYFVTVRNAREVITKGFIIN